MRLRFHHLLCVLGFRGLGYDEEFIEGMRSVVQKLRDNPSLEIELVDECDDICQACPFNKQQFCKNVAVGGEKAIRKKDRKVAKKLGYKKGEKHNVKDIFSLIKKRIKPDDLSVLCQVCPWRESGYCEEGLREIDNFFTQ